MAGRKVRVREVLEDIRSGMDDKALMRKYRISERGLRTLFKELSDAGLFITEDHYGGMLGEHTVVAGEVSADIRSGMGRSELMEKYGLSLRSLQGVVSVLLDAGAIERAELYGDLSTQDDTVIPENVRTLNRYFVDFETVVYERAHPEIQGRLVDINEYGVGVRGIEARPDDAKRLVVLGDPFGEVSPFECDALCRWTKRDPEGRCLAGFQILNISDRDLQELKKLIRLCTISG